MFAVRGEGLDAAQVTALTSICTQVCARAKRAAELSAGDRPRWFGTKASSPELDERIRAMSHYLNGQCTLITFVRKKTGQTVDKVLAESNDYGQVIRNIGQTTVGFRSTPRHTSSGLRIYAMNEIVNAIQSNDELEKVNYVYHEVSHKVIQTVDYAYGQTQCLGLAKRQPELAVRNADNWGYFLAEIV